ncbi:5-hydroxytryptamine receptor, partial [Orchesella cincta]
GGKNSTDGGTANANAGSSEGNNTTGAPLSKSLYFHGRGDSEVTPVRKTKSSRESGESKREKKAAKTLAIITGAFIMCWLPFFIMALVASACKSCNVSKNLMTLILWLGYFNSTLNPVIYTIFSPEFRLAFKKILFGKQHRKSRAVAL